MSEEVILSEEDWKIVEDRLKSMPDELKLGILQRSLTKKELGEEVQKRSPIGIAYAQMQLGFIKWLAVQSRVI